MDFKVYKKVGKKHKLFSLKESINNGYILIGGNGLHTRDSTIKLLESIDFYDAHKNLLYIGDCVALHNQMYQIIWDIDHCRYGLSSGDNFIPITPELSGIITLSGNIYDDVLDKKHIAIMIPNKNKKKRGKQHFSLTTLLSNYQYD